MVIDIPHAFLLVAQEVLGGRFESRIVRFDSATDVVRWVPNPGLGVIPATVFLKQVNLAPNSTSLEGVIVETMIEELTILGNGNVLYVDKGQEEGVKIGNTIDVVRSGDGLSNAGMPEAGIEPARLLGTRF